MKNSFKPLSIALQLGWSIALPLVGLALLGRLVDNKLGSSPAFLLTGIILALVVSSALVYKLAKEFMK